MQGAQPLPLVRASLPSSPACSPNRCGRRPGPQRCLCACAMAHMSLICFGGIARRPFARSQDKEYRTCMAAWPAAWLPGAAGTCLRAQRQRRPTCWMTGLLCWSSGNTAQCLCVNICLLRRLEQWPGRTAVALSAAPRMHACDPGTLGIACKAPQAHHALCITSHDAMRSLLRCHACMALCSLSRSHAHRSLLLRRSLHSVEEGAPNARPPCRTTAWAVDKRPIVAQHLG